MKLEPILLVGAGGHAKACIDVIEQEAKFTVIGLVGQEDEVGSSVLGYSVLGLDEDLPSLKNECANVLVTVGQIKTPEPRIRLFKLLKKYGFNLPTITSPKAYVSTHAKINIGTIVMHNAVINADAVIGSNCIINSNALIEHDAIVNNHCHISTGVIINGGVHIGMGTFVGSGSRIRESISIGEMCIIGMGQQVSVDCNNEIQVLKPKK